MVYGIDDMCQVYATAQLFRSSPFFLAIQAAYNDTAKSELFFKLHELQTCSWGVSEIGRVAQVRIVNDYLEGGREGGVGSSLIPSPRASAIIYD